MPANHEKYSERTLSRSDKGISDLEVERHLLIALSKGSGRTDLYSFVLDAALPVPQIERVLEKMLWVYEIEIEAGDDGNWLLTYDPKNLVRRQDHDDLTELERIRRRKRLWANIGTIPVFLLWTNIYFPAFVAYYAIRTLGRLPRLSRYIEDMKEARIPITVGSLWCELMRDDDAPNQTTSILSPETRVDRRFELEKFRSWMFGDRVNRKGEFDSEQDLLIWIADREGIVSRAEFTTYFAWTGTELEVELTRLMARFNGHVHVDENGVELFVFEDLRYLNIQHEDELPPAWEAPERERVSHFVASRVPFLHAMILFVIPLLTVMGASFLEIDFGPWIFANLYTLAISSIGIFFVKSRFEKKMAFVNARRIERNFKRAFLQPIVESGVESQWIDAAWLKTHAESYAYSPEAAAAVWPHNLEHITYPRSEHEFETYSISWPYTSTDEEGNTTDHPAPVSHEVDRIFDYIVRDLVPNEDFEVDPQSAETKRWLHFPQFGIEPAAAEAYRRKTHRWRNLQLHEDFEAFEHRLLEARSQRDSQDPLLSHEIPVLVEAIERAEVSSS